MVSGGLWCNVAPFGATAFAWFMYASSGLEGKILYSGGPSNRHFIFGSGYGYGTVSLYGIRKEARIRNRIRILDYFRLGWIRLV